MSTSLTPEEFELVVPEKKSNTLQVPANLNDLEIFRIIHLTNNRRILGNIRETRVKVFSAYLDS